MSHSVVSKKQSNYWVRAASAVALLILALTTPAVAEAATITLAWDPSPDNNVVGYVIEWGGSSGSYTSRRDVGNVTSYTTGGLVNGNTYYLIVRAYTADGTESAPSTEVSGAATQPGSPSPPPQHQLDVTVTLNGGAMGSVTSSPGSINCATGTCDELFNQGTAVTLTATTGDTFGGWGGACAGAGTNPQVTVTMNTAQACTATFDPPPPPTTRTLTVTLAGTGSGTVTSAPVGIDCPATSCSAGFGNGTNVTLTAAATSGSSFAGWSGTGCPGANTVIVVTMSTNRTCTATFDPSTSPTTTRTLTVTPAGTGSGAPSRPHPSASIARRRAAAPGLVTGRT